MKIKAITGIMLTLFLIGVLSIPVMAQPNVLNKELAAARKGVAKYHDTKKALAAGYVPLTPYIPMMGVHYAKMSLLDATFDIEEPEILLFTEDGEMIGVEYVVPMFEPVGFTGNSDIWGLHEATCHYADGSEIPAPSEGDCPEFNPDTGSPLVLWHPDLYTLHVWLFDEYENPLGIFAEINPSLP